MPYNILAVLYRTRYRHFIKNRMGDSSLLNFHNPDKKGRSIATGEVFLYGRNVCLSRVGRRYGPVAGVQSGALR